MCVTVSSFDSTADVSNGLKKNAPLDMSEDDLGPLLDSFSRCEDARYVRAFTTMGRNNPRSHRTAFHACGCECD